MKRHQDLSCEECFPGGFIKADLCARNSTMNIAIVFLFIMALLLFLLSLYYMVYYLVTTRRSNFIAHIRFNIVQGLFLVSILGKTPMTPVELIYLMDIFLHYSKEVYSPIDSARGIYVVALMFYTLYWIQLYIHTFSCSRYRTVRYFTNFFDICVSSGGMMYMLFSFLSDLDSDDFSKTNGRYLVTTLISLVLFASLFLITVLLDLRLRQLLNVSFSALISKMIMWMLAYPVVCLFILSLFQFLSWVDDGSGIHQLRFQACKSSDAIFWPVIKFLAQLSILSPLLAFYIFLICHRNSSSMRREWKEHSHLLEQQNVSSQSRRVYNELSLLIGTRLSSNGFHLSSPSTQTTL